MTHAVANCYRSVIEHFVRLPKDQRVPITFRHFEILAHLGKSPVGLLDTRTRITPHFISLATNNVEDGSRDGLPR